MAAGRSPTEAEIEGSADRPGIEATGIETTVAVSTGTGAAGDARQRLVEVERPADRATGACEALKKIRRREVGGQRQRAGVRARLHERGRKPRRRAGEDRIQADGRSDCRKRRCRRRE